MFQKRFKSNKERAMEAYDKIIAHDLKYPEHARLRQVFREREAIFDFLDFLEKMNVELYCKPSGNSRPRPFHVSRQDLTNEFFGINPVAFCRETEEMLPEELHAHLETRKQQRET